MTPRVGFDFCQPLGTGRRFRPSLSSMGHRSTIEEQDLEAFGRWVERFRGLIFGVCFHLLGDVEEARDAAQSTFLRAFVRRRQLRNEVNPGPWLRQISRNECLERLRSRRFEAPLSDDAPAPDAMRSVEARMLVRQALAALDEPHRLAVVLHYLHAYSLAQIAEFLELPETTVKSRMRNARAKIRREFEEALEKTMSQETPAESFADRVKAILAAAQAGDAAKLRTLLDDDPNLIAAQESTSGMTPLHVAASAGNAAVVELLLSLGADPNAKDDGDTALPLHYAAERGWLVVVKLLVEAGSDVNWTEDYHRRGPLGWAVVFREVHREVAEYLIAHGARLDLFSASALGLASEAERIVRGNPVALAERLIESDGGATPIEFAAGKGQPEIAAMLATYASALDLREQAALGREEALESAAREASPEERNLALLAAVRARQAEAAEVLLRLGADPDFAPTGTSPLYTAIANQDEAMARVLLAHGADLEFRDSAWNSTPLGWEVFFGHPEGVELALRLGAKADPAHRDLARAGERGELRRHSSGTAEGYRRVAQLLERAA